jgi:hypothetical protein
MFMPDLAAAAAVGPADHNVEAGGDPVPVVTHLRTAAGGNFMTAGDGARDPTRLAARARRHRLLAGRRQPLRIDLHCLRGRRLCEARRTKRDRQTGPKQNWFHFQLNDLSFAGKTGKVAAGSACGVKLRPPTLEYDLVGPAPGHFAVLLGAHGPGQQR